MGTLLAIFLVLSINLVPAGSTSLTIDNYVVEGVGIYDESTRFLLTRTADASWQLHDAQGEPWYQVAVAGPRLTLTTSEGGISDVDLGAALGLPADAWWTAGAIEPPGLTPILVERLPQGLNVTIDGMRAAEVRW